MAERTFVDEVRIHVAAGKGGDGCLSFDRQKFRPKGPADGGNGGPGGSVILRVDPNVATFSELARNPHIKATRGVNGEGHTRHGAAGEDQVVLVPDGTVVIDEDDRQLADLVGAGSEFVVARGGAGGRGNKALATPKRRAPAFSERGGAGEERWVRLELKMLADVGLVGFPNAGKSSLVARMSAAKPKIASYPFTTLTPNLGVAESGGQRFVVADVPGLIEGASEGKGLGLAFLRHLERTRVLCFVLDLSDPTYAPGDALASLRAELRAHLPAFDERPGIVAANKTDLAGTEDALAAARVASDDAGFTCLAVSAQTGDGVEALMDALAEAVARATAAEDTRTHRLITLRPDTDEVTVEREGSGWRVHHAASLRLLERFDINQTDALVHVQDRLTSYGVEDALARAGAVAGDDVYIGDHVLEYTPDDQVDAQ